MAPLPTGHDGNTHSFFAASPDSWSFGAGVASLRPDFDPQIHRIHVEFTDTGTEGTLGGDTLNDEIGSDVFQSATIRSPDGTILASGQVYAEAVHTLQAPDGTTFAVYEIEIAGVFQGYLSTYPVEPGVTFAVLGSGDVTLSNEPTYTEFENIACFGPNVMIDTAGGPVPAAWLTRGDPVLTLDNGFQPLEWVGRSLLDGTGGEMVEIAPGALGDGCPAFPTLVSGQHRLLVHGPELELYFGEREMLVPARSLSALPGFHLRAAQPGEAVYHLKLAGHELLRSEGFWSESFFAEAPGVLKPGWPKRTVRPVLKPWEARMLFGMVEAPAALLRAAA